jgi:hypothetical protein
MKQRGNPEVPPELEPFIDAIARLLIEIDDSNEGTKREPAALQRPLPQADE